MKTLHNFILSLKINRNIRRIKELVEQHQQGKLSFEGLIKEYLDMRLK
jgi:hypothetical protein